MLAGRRDAQKPHQRFYLGDDLSSVAVVDAQRDIALCEIYLLDKDRSADGRRRVVERLAEPAAPTSPTAAGCGSGHGIAPVFGS